MLWLQRWNFIERAKLERQLWDAFEQGKDLEGLVNELRNRLDDPSAVTEPFEQFRLEVWSQTLGRIRKIEALMKDRSPND
ncbi:MAG: hypothetical protein EBU30_03715 [Synechococcaceae bacterium WB6_3B_236]|jgi:hypothetical protein|nr:hypothetical protein [Synechococcaceae bacterium WB6_3B_236]